MFIGIIPILAEGRYGSSADPATGWLTGSPVGWLLAGYVRIGLLGTISPLINHFSLDIKAIEILSPHLRAFEGARNCYA